MFNHRIHILSRGYQDQEGGQNNDRGLTNTPHINSYHNTHIRIAYLILCVHIHTLQFEPASPCQYHILPLFPFIPIILLISTLLYYPHPHHYIKLNQAMPSFFTFVSTTIQRIKTLIKKHPYLSSSLLSLAIIVIAYSFTRRKARTPLKIGYLSEFMNALKNNLVTSITNRSPTHLEYMTQEGKFLLDGSIIPRKQLFQYIMQNKIKYRDIGSKKELNDMLIGLFCFAVSLGFSLFLVMKKSSTETYKFNDDNQLNVRFKDIYGLQKPKLILQETIDYLVDSQKYEEIGCRLRKGIIFYGPPGTGKTMLAKAMATESNSKFISCSASEFCEMYVGIGPKRIRQLFSDAKNHKSAIIFIDQIDALGRKEDRQSDKQRNNTLNELLVQMDGFQSTNKVVVIAATNRLEMIDSALLRSGRFDLKIQVPLPNKQERQGILNIHLSKKPSSVPYQVISEIASSSQGLCGADLESLTNQAAYKALRKEKKEISVDELKEAFKQFFRGHSKIR